MYIISAKVGKRWVHGKAKYSTLGEAQKRRQELLLLGRNKNTLRIDSYDSVYKF